MSLHIGQLRAKVIHPVLRWLHPEIPYFLAAENLLLLTHVTEALVGESVYLAQIQGPALGIYQMEPATHNDIYNNFLKYRMDVLDKLKKFSVGWPRSSSEELVWNLAYATAMARIHYYRQPPKLPEPDDVRGLAQYWKTYYNTEHGKGSVDKAITAYERVILSHDKEENK